MFHLPFSLDPWSFCRHKWQHPGKHYMALLQTVWTSYSFIHEVKSHLKLAERGFETGLSGYLARTIPTRSPTTRCQKSETFGYKS